jgi:HSP20 family protein
MTRDLIRLMNSLFLPAAESCQEAAWRPSMDLYRTPDGWLAKLELAGVRPQDVELRLSGRRLTVLGQRRDCVAEHGLHVYQMEIAYSHFERTIELPSGLDEVELTTDFRDGMLLIHIRTEGGSNDQ